MRPVVTSRTTWGTHPKGILVGIFVARRVKNCQHLNRLRHADEKRGYRLDADDSQLDTACLVHSGVYTGIFHAYMYICMRTYMHIYLFIYLVRAALSLPSSLFFLPGFRKDRDAKRNRVRCRRSRNEHPNRSP